MEEKPSKIIYWYDRNIRLYTFEVLDPEGNNIFVDYSSKQLLNDTKTYFKKRFGIKPIKYK